MSLFQMSEFDCGIHGNELYYYLQLADASVKRFADEFDWFIPYYFNNHSLEDYSKKMADFLEKYSKTEPCYDEYNEGEGYYNCTFSLTNFPLKELPFVFWSIYFLIEHHYEITDYEIDWRRKYDALEMKYHSLKDKYDYLRNKFMEQSDYVERVSEEMLNDRIYSLEGWDKYLDLKEEYTDLDNRHNDLLYDYHALDDELGEVYEQYIDLLKKSLSESEFNEYYVNLLKRSKSETNENGVNEHEATEI